MHCGILSVKNIYKSIVSRDTKFSLAILFAVILVISGITLSILNNSGIIGKISPVLIGNYAAPGEITGFSVEDNYAYVTYDVYEDYNPEIPLESNLRILNISYKENPEPITDYNTPMGADCISVKGNIAFVGGRGLQIIDISDKENPEIIGICPMELDDSCIHVEEDYTYIGGYEHTRDCYFLYIVDTGNKENPEIAGICPMDDKIMDIDVEKNYAYIANWNSGLQIIDISDKENPEIIGVYDGPITTSVFIEGDYAYTIDYGLQVIDISDKENPYSAGSCSIPGSGYNVCVTKNYAYVVNGSSYSNEAAASGLQVIDISDKENPEIVASCTVDIPGLEFLEVNIKGNYAYIAGSQTGLKIIRIIN